LHIDRRLATLSDQSTVPIQVREERSLSNAASVASVFRWAGSKRKLLPKLRAYWDGGNRRYLEPFAGSASLFFSIQPKKAILSDLNCHLIETFEVIRNETEKVFATASSYGTGAETYYRLRRIQPRSLDAIGRAARFIYLNRYCFNGIYRTDLLGRFNVPFGSEGTGSLPSLETFQRIASLLERAALVVGDFESVVSEHVRNGDFVYLDPPYAVSNRRIFRQYGPDTFGLADLDRLANVLKRIDDAKARFVLSYAYCSEAKEAFRGWHKVRTFTQRNVSGFAEHRRRAAELIVSNFEPLADAEG
jgi:DNA adenine methylase